jgi:chromosome segregation ATPase
VNALETDVNRPETDVKQTRSLTDRRERTSPMKLSRSVATLDDRIEQFQRRQLGDGDESVEALRARLAAVTNDLAAIPARITAAESQVSEAEELSISALVDGRPRPEDTIEKARAALVAAQADARMLAEARNRLQADLFAALKARESAHRREFVALVREAFGEFEAAWREAMPAAVRLQRLHAHAEQIACLRTGGNGVGALIPDVFRSSASLDAKRHWLKQEFPEHV